MKYIFAFLTNIILLGTLTMLPMTKVLACESACCKKEVSQKKMPKTHLTHHVKAQNKVCCCSKHKNAKNDNHCGDNNDDCQCSSCPCAAAVSFINDSFSFHFDMVEIVAFFEKQELSYQDTFPKKITIEFWQPPKVA